MLLQVYLATYDILLNCDRRFFSHLQCTSFSLKKLCFSSKVLVLQAASSEKKTPAAAADWLGELYLILLCAHTYTACYLGHHSSAFDHNSLHHWQDKNSNMRSRSQTSAIKYLDVTYLNISDRRCIATSVKGWEEC